MTRLKNMNNPKRQPVEVIALIPARGGQQSVPYKNLQELGGKSLLAWAVDVAMEAESVDAVAVSTEDERIAAEAGKLGAIVIPRPAEFSQATSGDAGFYQHAAKWLEEEKSWKPELIVNLRPTSPLRFAKDIDAMVDYMRSSGADGLKSVIPTPLHPYKMWMFAGDANLGPGEAGELKPVFDSEFRREHGPDQPRQKIQEMFPVYFQDGQVDITRPEFVLRPEALEKENVWGENIHGFVLDPRTSTDLDEPQDFIRAEKIYRMISEERREAGE